MSIPEDEIEAQIEREWQTGNSTPDYANGFRDCARWAERFYYDARSEPPTPLEEYIVYRAGKWQLMVAMGGGRWAALKSQPAYHDAPYYKPMPPAPEDDK